MAKDKKEINDCGINSGCRCIETDCPRRGKCKECQEHHRLLWSRTDCGK